MATSNHASLARASARAHGSHSDLSRIHLDRQGSHGNCSHLRGWAARCSADREDTRLSHGRPSLHAESGSDRSITPESFQTASQTDRLASIPWIPN